MSTAHERFLRYYLQFAHHHRDDDAAIEQEYRQLQRAGDILVYSDEWESNQRNRWIVDYVDALDRFWERRGFWDDKETAELYGQQAVKLRQRLGMIEE